MRLKPVQPRPLKENTIALINVVFLMLIFFLLAGTLVSHRDRNLHLALTGDAKPGGAYSDALIVRSDGSLVYRGKSTAVEDLPTVFAKDTPKTIKVAPDRRGKAQDLVRVMAALRGVGIETVTLVTQRGTGGAE